jgi:hypothetical protein
VSILKESLEADKEDDCCMTAITNNGVYVFGKLKPNADKQPKADAKRIAEAKERTAKYEKK